ncbi:MAG: hypothetical protein ACJ76F_10690 [Bacteroidia bacterium]
MKNSSSALRKQSRALISQQAVTTFFYLIENHKKMIDSLNFGEYGNGVNGLEAIYNKTKVELNEYGSYILQKTFPNSHKTTFHPISLIKEYNEELKEIYDSINHISKLVTQKLKDDPFYHETLYNYMSIGEKYMFGLYSLNCKGEVVSSVFSYENFFRRNTNYVNAKESGYLPKIWFDLISTVTRVKPNLPVLEFKNILSQIMCVDIFADHLISPKNPLECLEIEITSSINGTPKFTKSVNIYRKFIDDLHLRLDFSQEIGDFINEYAYEKIKVLPINSYTKFEFEIKFYLRCNNSKYSILRRFECKPPFFQTVLK